MDRAATTGPACADSARNSPRRSGRRRARIAGLGRVRFANLSLVRTTFGGRAGRRDCGVAAVGSDRRRRADAARSGDGPIAAASAIGTAAAGGQRPGSRARAVSRRPCWLSAIPGLGAVRALKARIELAGPAVAATIVPIRTYSTGLRRSRSSRGAALPIQAWDGPSPALFATCSALPINSSVCLATARQGAVAPGGVRRSRDGLKGNPRARGIRFRTTRTSHYGNRFWPPFPIGSRGAANRAVAGP